MAHPSQEAANRRLAAKLLGVTVAMFGFGYALVPLYDVFCDITGFNGKTGRLSASQAATVVVDESRLITVEFATSVGATTPWEFKPLVQKVSVHPGAETMVEFEAYNYAQFTVVANAVPSVVPISAARYFNKTECFCFTRQSLEPGETKKLPVRFVVDPKLPSHIRVVTLAYTFFELEEVTAAISTPAAPRS